MTFYFGVTYPLWMEVTLALLWLLMLLVVVRSLRRCSPGRRMMLLVLRSLMLMGLWLWLHDIRWASHDQEPEHLKSLIVVDRSASMGTMTPKGSSRMEMALPLVEAIYQGTPSEILVFDEEPKRISSPEGIQLDEVGRPTRFDRLLSFLRAEATEYGTIYLLSDGHDHSVATHREWTWLAQENLPVHTILVGDEAEGADAAILSVDAPAFGFVRTPMRLDIQVSARGVTAFPPHVEIREGEQQVAVEPLSFDEQGFSRVSVTLVSETVGEHLYSVILPPVPGERTLANNRTEVLVETARDKIQVLHIAGSVTADLQALRGVFERDDRIDLTAFYILRTRENQQIGVDGRLIAPEELALVQFPVEEIFDRQLFSFDVVVFQDFDAGNYFHNSFQASKLMAKIARFIEEHHGGLIVIGGPKTAAGPPLSATAIGAILPVQLPSSREAFQTQTLSFEQLTRLDGHPLVDAVPEDALWPGWMNASLRAQGQGLITGPRNQVLMATREVGSGRVLFLNHASTWLWRRQSLQQGQGASAYAQFWQTAINWVTDHPQLRSSRMDLVVDPLNPLEVRVQLTLKDEDYRPQSGESVVLEATSVRDEALTSTLAMTLDAEGRSSEKLTLKEPGYYRFSMKEGPVDHSVEDRLLFVGGFRDELAAVQPVPETLQALSRASGGRFFPSPDSFSLKDAPPKRAVKPRQAPTQEGALRQSYGFFAVWMVLFCLEWWLRRSAHLA